MTAEEAIERVALREAMLESLKREEPDQYLGFKRQTASVLLERGVPVMGDGADLRRIDYQRFREIVWKLINSGILVPGKDSSNENWPFLSITEIGRDYLEKGGPDVYDPENYVGQLAIRYPVDEVEARYLGQRLLRSMLTCRTPLPSCLGQRLSTSSSYSRRPSPRATKTRPGTSSDCETGPR